MHRQLLAQTDGSGGVTVSVDPDQIRVSWNADATASPLDRALAALNAGRLKDGVQMLRLLLAYAAAGMFWLIVAMLLLWALPLFAIRDVALVGERCLVFAIAKSRSSTGRCWALDDDRRRAPT